MNTQSTSTRVPHRERGFFVFNVYDVAINGPIPRLSLTPFSEGVAMPTKYLDGYEIEFTSELLPGTDQWGAYVAIFAPSDNPMHLAEVYHRQRVAADLAFSSAEDAEAEAEKAGAAILEQLRSSAT